MTVTRSPHPTEPPGRAQGLRESTPSTTERSGTASPSRYHHLASHMWHVVNDRSLPLTDIVIEMSSPWLQTGHVPSSWSFMYVSSTQRRSDRHSTSASFPRARP